MKYLGLLLVFVCSAARADLWLTTSLYTTHFDNDWDYNESQSLIGLEYQKNDWFINASHFLNSYGDKSNSLMAGYILRGSDFSYKVGIGAAGGYKEKYCKEPFYYDYTYGIGNGSTHTIQVKDQDCIKTKSNGTYSPLFAQSIVYGFNRIELEATLIYADAFILTARFKIN